MASSSCRRNGQNPAIAYEIISRLLAGRRGRYAGEALLQHIKVLLQMLGRERQVRLSPEANRALNPGFFAREWLGVGGWGLSSAQIPKLHFQHSTLTGGDVIKRYECHPVAVFRLRYPAESFHAPRVLGQPNTRSWGPLEG